MTTDAEAARRTYAELTSPNTVLDRPRPASPTQEYARTSSLLLLGLFAGALAARLIVLFLVTEPQNPGLGWYGDVYHHWQIAYLSMKVGFSHGFLRLWDLKGLEFFWGLLHPLVLIALFKLTGSVDILVPRMLSATAASVSLTILFVLLRRYFNRRVALASYLLAAFTPVAMFNDSVGMQEPLGLMLLLGGLLLLDNNRPSSAGLLWALAGMVRAEYWVFGLGLVVAAALHDRFAGVRERLAGGWLVPSILYMGYLMHYTGNPIYPVYWNFLAGTAGEWIEDIPLGPEQALAQFGARIVLVISLAGAAWLLVKRRRYSLLLLLGAGNVIMLGIVMGLGEYVKAWVTRILWDRLLVVPYMHLGVLLAIVLFHWLPRKFPNPLFSYAAWGVTAAVLFGSQLMWTPILDTYRPLNELWVKEYELAEHTAAHYNEKTILIPEDRQALTYALVAHFDIPGDRIQGQMYDPFSYIGGNIFAEWSDNRELVRDWLVREDIGLILIYRGNQPYEQMIELEPDWFSYRGSTYRGAFDIYFVEVNSDR